MKQQALSIGPDLDSTYQAIYGDLNELRELFHRSGRFDDSNAKLDEVVKLVAMYLAFKRQLIPVFPVLKRGAVGRQVQTNVLSELRKTFDLTKRLPCYRNQDGSSIFGANPALNFQAGDEELATIMIDTVTRAMEHAFHHKLVDRPFDMLNEAFGHFVRDNFRSHIEDAQYMTPPEVVDVMVGLGLHGLIEEKSDGIQDPLVIADPSCGVGSFLTAFYRQATKHPTLQRRRIRLVGQDKVDRMVRLSKINLALFEAVDHQITIGNSLAKGSPLDSLNGKVDLILTNPPFGAKFRGQEIMDAGVANLPIFGSSKLPERSIDSELLFVDRALALLQDRGLLIIVIPDGVVSAKGAAAFLRQRLKSLANVKAIIELPSVTFAQAGTRTRTAILYLQKTTEVDTARSVFLASCDELGFEVSSRKGVPIKVTKGKNELPEILAPYISEYVGNRTSAEARVILDRPSCVLVPYTQFIDSSWTPNHYNAHRFSALKVLHSSSDYVPTPLSELVDFVGERRNPTRVGEKDAFISVLHIIGDGMLDVSGALEYRPVTPGLVARPGEILLSKINPRIARVIVVPELAPRVLCSAEFEVMAPQSNLDPYLLAFLLLSKPVQAQIMSLTSGTSASHNRVRSRDLATVTLPIAKRGSKLEKALSAAVSEYRQSYVNMIRSTISIADIRRRTEAWF